MYANDSTLNCSVEKYVAILIEVEALFDEHLDEANNWIKSNFFVLNLNKTILYGFS